MSSNLAKSTFWLVVSEIIFNLSGYIIHSFVGRILGPADYGRYGLVVTLTTMVIILIGNGIPTAMAKYISEIFETNPRLVLVIKKKAIILQSILIGGITIIFFLSAPLISYVLGDTTLTPLFRISTLIIPAFAMASFYFSYYTGLHKFNIQSILKTLRSVLKVVAIIGLAYTFRVPGSIVGYALAAFSVFLIAFTLDQFKYTKEIKKAAEGQNLSLQSTFETKKLVSYAWQVILFFLAYELLISIDLYLVKGILHNDYLTGIYNASLTVGRIPYYIFYALTIMLLPVISKSTAEENHEQTNLVISQSLRLMIILLVPSVILMSEFSRPIIKIFYSTKYIEAAYPMSILAYGVGFLTIFYVMSFVLNGAGKTKIPMWISIFGVIINTILNYILIKRFGIVGSAVATTITSFVAMLAILYYIQRDFGVLIKFKNLLKISLAGIAMYAASLLFDKGEFIFLLWSAILFALYLAILYFLDGITKNDIDYLKQIISKKKKKTEIQEELSGNEPQS
ncbi:MAG TPA: flippase [Candidatus Moranbacteria bacterium]|nr:flippase [Candidatus Moranbacteria bacterium]HRZ33889.1 flippase [Candidatus Moranbacteria bacterium]